MIYTILKWIVKLTINSFFGKVVVHGQSNVPEKGGVVFVANHPSAFMDPMVVAAFVHRKIHFVAAAEFFGKGFKARFFQNHLNMIPVFRPSIHPGESHKNADMFSKCFDLLNVGGSILVFPEGNSITEKRIRKIKTGVARMTIGSDLSEGSTEDIWVVPIGLNYANPHRFRSDLFVNIGEAIPVKGYTDSLEDVQLLTESIENALVDTVIHVDEKSNDDIVKKMDIVLNRHLKDKGDLQEIFNSQQTMISAFESLSKTHPEKIAELSIQLNGYLKKIKDLGLDDSSISEISVMLSGKEILRLIFLSPLFLFGFLTNAGPYYLSILLIDKLNLFNDADELDTKEINPFQGSLGMAIGMVLFLIYYIGLAVWAGIFFHSIIVGVLLPVLFYFSGLFCMRYIRWFFAYQKKRRLRKIIRENKSLFVELVTEREAILNGIHKVVG